MKYFSMFSGIGGFELGISNGYKKTRGCGQEKDLSKQGSGCFGSKSDIRQSPTCIGFSEIDKYAIATYLKHFPTHKNYGNARDINPKELPDFDILCGGFPCQSFSIAGKRKGFQDTRGTLFHEICRIVAVKKPRLLFLENVKGLLSADDGRCFATILTSLDELGYDVEWQVLNSKNFGVPQNRERVFIIGHLRGKGGRQVFPIGKAMSKSIQERENATKSVGCLTARYWKMGKTDTYIKPKLNQLNSGESQGNRVYSIDGISQTLAGQAGGRGAKTGLYAIPVLTPNRLEKRQNGRRFKDDGEEMFTLTGQDIHGIMIQSHSPRSGNPKKGGTGLLESSEHCFTLDSSPHYVNKIRRLTPIECERLQGFPDGWTIGSDTQRYKQCGNAVTVNVIETIATRLLI